MNLFTGLNYDLSKEVSEELLQTAKLTVKRIASAGQTTEIFNQDCDELAILLEGTAIIEFTANKRELQAGDWVYIKAHEQHRVINTSPRGLWLAIYLK